MLFPSSLLDMGSFSPITWPLLLFLVLFFNNANNSSEQESLALLDPAFCRLVASNPSY